jgi:uncharacterized protein (DUF1697 family)
MPTSRTVAERRGRREAIHVAFLRGVGGPKPAPGAELRQCFGAAGYDPVIPVLGTGNVIFGCKGGAKPKAADLSALLEKHFGFPLPVILRSAADIAAMFAADSFRGIDPASEVRFVSMLGENAKPVEGLPDPPADTGFRLLKRIGNNLFLARHNAGEGTPAMMAHIERVFGKTNVTTRNWNTMEKIAAAMERL